MDDTLTDRVLGRVQQLYPDLEAARNPRELIRTKLGYLDAHLYDVEHPQSGRLLASSHERKGNTHTVRFDPTDEAGLDVAVHEAVAYLKDPNGQG